MSTEDYFSSGFRHYEAAQTLNTLNRIDESAYLAGYVIECSLKKLIETHTGRPARGYGHDLTGMSGPALSLAALLAPASGRYRVDILSTLPSAMSYWSPALRYWTTGDVTVADAACVLQAAHEAVTHILVPLVLDGAEDSIR